MREVRIPVALARRDAEDVTLLIVSFVLVLEIPALVCAVRIGAPDAVVVVRRTPYALDGAPAAEVEPAVAFAQQFDDTFLLDGVEKGFFRRRLFEC